MRLCCNKCGKSVTTEVPDTTIVRAWIECPECIEKDEKWMDANIEKFAKAIYMEFCPEHWDYDDCKDEIKRVIREHIKPDQEPEKEGE